MPGISIHNGERTVRHPAVSTEIFGAGEGRSQAVTLIITRDGNVQMGEHDLLVEYARECLLDSRMSLAEYADQILAPHPLIGQYVHVDVALDHNGNTSKVIVFPKGGKTRMYEWAI
jgi:hypothetical protein